MKQRAREKGSDDPAYTQDVRHLAFPLRRNSGPEKNNANYFENTGTDKNKRMSKIRKRPETKSNLNIVQSSSNENIDNEGSHSGRGRSLDRFWVQRNIMNHGLHQSNHEENKSQSKLNMNKLLDEEFLKSPKQNKKSCKQTYSKERAKDFSDSVTSDDTVEFYRSNPKISNKPANQSITANTLQIGKRFLKGEIGIKSFNYYLLKEGLKSSKKTFSKQTSEPISRKSNSEENLYEEIHYKEKLNSPVFNQGSPISSNIRYQSQILQSSICNTCNENCSMGTCYHCQSRSVNEMYFNLKNNSKNDLQNSKNSTMPLNYQKSTANQRENVLQFQSYNPNNPGIYKLETTPVTFTSEYNPIQHISNIFPKYPSSDNSKSNIPKSKPNISSSSNDSIHLKYKSNFKPNSSTQNKQMSNAGLLENRNLSTFNCKAQSINELSRNRNYYGEISDSSLGESLNSYPFRGMDVDNSSDYYYDHHYQPNSESEPCNLSDNCQYGCTNGEFSSNYFSSECDESYLKRPNDPYYELQKYSAALKTHPSKYAENFMQRIANIKQNNLQHTLSCNNINDINLQIKKTFKTLRNVSDEKNSKSGSDYKIQYHQINDKEQSQQKLDTNNYDTSNSKLKYTANNTDASFNSINPEPIDDQITKHNYNQNSEYPKTLIKNNINNEGDTNLTSKIDVPNTITQKNTITVPVPKRRPSLKDIDWNEIDEGDDDVFISEIDNKPVHVSYHFN